MNLVLAALLLATNTSWTMTFVEKTAEQIELTWSETIIKTLPPPPPRPFCRYSQEGENWHIPPYSIPSVYMKKDGRGCTEHLGKTLTLWKKPPVLQPPMRIGGTTEDWPDMGFAFHPKGCPKRPGVYC